MFDKLDAYNLVANLIPGAALVFALHYSGFPTPRPEDVVAFLLVAFVVGVMMNRLGSLVIDEPLRRTVSVPFSKKKFRVLHEKNYKSFVTSEKDDKKLEILVANSGLYRTFFTCGLVFGLLIVINWIWEQFEWPNRILLGVGFLAAMIIFFFAFRKEDDYLHQRLDNTDSEKE